MEDDANLVVRMPPSLRYRVRIAAVEDDCTIQEWVTAACQEYLVERRGPGPDDAVR